MLAVNAIRRMLLLAVLIITGCATSDYQPYEGRNNVHEGVGGTKRVVNGVEFWANGSPPRKFAILGVVTSEIGAVTETRLSSDLRSQLALKTSAATPLSKLTTTHHFED